MKIGKTGQIALMVAAAVAATVLGYFVHAWNSGAPVAPGKVSAEPVFAASFSDLRGQRQALRQWQGKVVVLNFWATWCPPCRTEIPEFVKLQEKYRERGVIFIGIAIDQKDKVRAFADETGINYPLLLGEIDASELARHIGNRLGGLPFTAVIDRGGVIVTTELGGLTGAKLESILKPLI